MDHPILHAIQTQLADCTSDHDAYRILSSMLDDMSYADMYTTVKLLCDIMTLWIDDKNQDATFQPMIVLFDKRSFAITDLTDGLFAILENLDTDTLPPIVSSRINDILWVQKNDYRAAEKAVTSYLVLAGKADKWVDSIRYISRANTLANKLGRNTEAVKTVTQFIDDTLQRIHLDDFGFFILRLIDIQFRAGRGDLHKYLEYIGEIIATEISSNSNDHRIQQATELKIQILKKIDTSKVNQAKQVLAEYYIKRAEDICATVNFDTHQACMFYELALPLLHEVKNRTQENDIMRILEPLKKVKMSSMATFEHKIDISDTIALINSEIEGKSFDKCIMTLCRFVDFFHKDDLEDKVIKNYNDHPLSNLFTKTYLDRNGHTAFELPGLDMRNPRKDAKLLELHMISELIFQSQMYAQLGIWYIFRYIIENFSVTQRDLVLIIDNNAFVPNDRKEIIKFGLSLGLQGKIYESLHIIVPQIENLFREIAHECGAVVMKYDNDWTAEESKTLGSVFELPELIECFDGDILFFFQAMLNSKAGANLRNLIAHGVMNSDEGNSLVCAYFICACIKLLSYFSPDCLKLYGDTSNPKITERTGNSG